MADPRVSVHGVVELTPRGASVAPSIAALVTAVDNAEYTGVLVDRLRVASAELRALGVSVTMLDAVDGALRSGDWTLAAAAFAECRDDIVLFYLGPMRAREGLQPSMGMVLALRDSTAREAFRVILDATDNLGRSLFGFPCRYSGRSVEFYDLIAVAGGPLATEEAPIALFTPFFLGNVQADARALRRTVIWSSVVVERHHAIAERVASGRLRIDGNAPKFMGMTEDMLRICTGLWLSLHELFHSSGPLPLFEPESRKAGLARYGVVEEARVDMSAFLSLTRLGGPDSPFRAAAELILTERLMRSARHGLAAMNAGREPSLDSQHGLIWAGVLSEGGALRDSSDETTMSIDFARATDAVTAILGEIYAAESDTVDHPDARAEALSAFAERVHRKWLGPAAPGLRATRSWRATGPTAATLRAGPLATLDVSDCESSR